VKSDHLPDIGLGDVFMVDFNAGVIATVKKFKTTGLPQNVELIKVYCKLHPEASNLLNFTSEITCFKVNMTFIGRKCNGTSDLIIKSDH
jgi:hypothetical protein